jgi:hypothetical protein
MRVVRAVSVERLNCLGGTILITITWDIIIITWLTWMDVIAMSRRLGAKVPDLKIYSSWPNSAALVLFFSLRRLILYGNDMAGDYERIGLFYQYRAWTLSITWQVVQIRSEFHQWGYGLETHERWQCFVFFHFITLVVRTTSGEWRGATALDSRPSTLKDIINWIKLAEVSWRIRPREVSNQRARSPRRPMCRFIITHSSRSFSAPVGLF